MFHRRKKGGDRAGHAESATLPVVMTQSCGTSGGCSSGTTDCATPGVRESFSVSGLPVPHAGSIRLIAHASGNSGSLRTPRAAIGTGHSRAYGCHDCLRRRFPFVASASVRTGGPGARLERERLSDFFRRHGELVEPLADGVGDGVSRRRDDRHHHHFPQASGR